MILQNIPYQQFVAIVYSMPHKLQSYFNAYPEYAKRFRIEELKEEAE
jgi:hypothetical protein